MGISQLFAIKLSKLSEYYDKNLISFTCKRFSIRNINVMSPIVSKFDKLGQMRLIPFTVPVLLNSFLTRLDNVIHVHKNELQRKAVNGLLLS